LDQSTDSVDEKEEEEMLAEIQQQGGMVSALYSN
jgi:hypothetical protein